MNTIYDDEEIRRMAIDLMLAPTARDQQTRIGASDLSNQCDRCLALAFAGVKRESVVSEKTWLGRTAGTAIHRFLEERGAQQPALLGGAPEFEKHVYFADLRGYGLVGGSIDVRLPRQIVDWKGSTRKKSALLRDHVAIMRGEEPPFGREGIKARLKITLSERAYADEMASMAYKVNGYFGQQALYMHGSNLEGHPVERCTLVFVNRDGTGYFDLPHGEGYDDPKRVHDVYVLSLPYIKEHALSVIARGQAIYDRLEAGEPFAEFARHDLCFQCSQDMASEARNVDIIATFGSPAAA